LTVSYKIGTARDVETILGDMRANPDGIKFNEARKVADHFFGEFGKPRIAGSHHVYKMPWPGDPGINLQKDGPKAKRYQVVQMLEAIERLKAIKAARATEAATAKVSGKKGR
jgi:hypothetical protein